MKLFLVFFNCGLLGCYYPALTEPVHPDRALVVTGEMLALSAFVASLAALLVVGEEWLLNRICGDANAVDLCD